MLSMVDAMRATIAGGMANTGTEANNWIRVVIAASPGHQREKFEVMIPEFARTTEAAQLDHRQHKIDAIAFRAQYQICLLSWKLGLYCGEVVEISQPLLPIGIKMPMSMPGSRYRGLWDADVMTRRGAPTLRIRSDSA